MWRFVQFTAHDRPSGVSRDALIVEFVVLRRWCHKICPLGALLSLLARGSKTFRPTVDRSLCLRCDGVACETCVGLSRAYRPVRRCGRRSMVECEMQDLCAGMPGVGHPFPLASGRDARCLVSGSWRGNA
ncbi:MAG: hypothetical protein ACLT98_06735 [Eggerthellaceae bacterium]